MTDKKAPKAGNLALVFEKPVVKAGDSKVILQYGNGEAIVKCLVGKLCKGSIDTQLGNIDCWVFEPLRAHWGPAIKRRQASAIKVELNCRLFNQLVGADEEVSNL